MILFPNCKINLGLRVTGKREDGYHNIETIFYPLSLKDAAELNLSLKSSSGGFELVVSGSAIAGDIQNNLCYKAWQLIKNDFPGIGSLKMHLLKAIPAGAGLGGGSSDGAHTLLLLNHELGLNLTREQLINYALKLGSDCPFFILNKPCLAIGRGEVMEEVPIYLEEYYFVLVDPQVHISTAWAFNNLVLNKTDRAGSLKDLIALPVDRWKDELVNDFEAPVFEEYESLKSIKAELYAAGAVYASLTGTGSCVYGIFNKKIKPDLHKIPDHYKMYHLN